MQGRHYDDDSYDHGRYRRDDGWYDDGGYSYRGEHHDHGGYDLDDGYGYVAYEEPVDDDVGGGRRSRGGLWFVLGVMVGLLSGSGGALLASSAVELPRFTPSAAADEETSVDAGRDRTVEPVDSVGVGTTAASPGDDANLAPIPTVAGAGSRGSDGQPLVDGSEPGETPAPAASTSTGSDVIACTVDGTGAPLIEVINNSSTLSDYLLSIAFQDATGTTAVGQPGEIYALRAGEHSVEYVIVDQPGGVACEVVNLIRQPVETTPEAAADVSSCEILGANPLGEVAATLSVTNSGAAPNDFLIDLAIIDANGLRRGTGFVAVDGIGPGDTVQVDVDSIVGYAPGLQCQMVGVHRTAS